MQNDFPNSSKGSGVPLTTTLANFHLHTHLTQGTEHKLARYCRTASMPVSALPASPVLLCRWHSGPLSPQPCCPAWSLSLLLDCCIFRCKLFTEFSSRVASPWAWLQSFCGLPSEALSKLSPHHDDLGSLAVLVFCGPLPFN